MSTYNIFDARVCSTNENNNPHDEAQGIQACPHQVVLGEGGALANQHEPHHGGEVEGEAGNEEGRRDSQQVREERDRFSKHPPDKREERNQQDP